MSRRRLTARSTRRAGSGSSGASTSSISPTTMTQWDDATSITVNGAGFTASSIITVDGTSITTAFVNASQLTGTVSASILQTSGAKAVKVGGSNSQTLTVTAWTFATDLAASIIGNWDAEHVTVTDAIDALVDQASSPHNYTAAAGARPSLVSSATPSGKPAARFTAASSNVMETGAFSVNQQFIRLFVMKTRTWTSGTRFGDGATVNQCVTNLFDPAAPIVPGSISMYAGTAFVCTTDYLPLDTWGLFYADFNGASSSGQIAQSAAVTGNPGTGNVNGGFAMGGAGNATLFADVDIAKELILKPAPSAANKTRLFNELTAYYGLPTLPTKAIQCDGDSLTRGGIGISDPATQSYPAQLSALLGASYGTMVNEGVDSQTLVNMQSDASTTIDTKKYATKVSILCAWGGTNDIHFGADAATTLSRLWTYCDARRTAGHKVVVFKVISRNWVTDGNGTAAAKAAIAVTVNAGIDSDWASHADALVNFDGSGIGAANDYQNATLFSDGVHLTAAGYAIVAGLAYTQVIAF